MPKIHAVKQASILLLALAFSGSAPADFSGPGSAPNLVTVSTIDSLNEDDEITLEGFIVKQIKSEHYMFKDTTGEIEIEIDKDVFKDVTVTPETKVRIIGEVDEDWLSTTIDVERIEIVE